MSFRYQSCSAVGLRLSLVLCLAPFTAIHHIYLEEERVSFAGNALLRIVISDTTQCPAMIGLMTGCFKRTLICLWVARPPIRTV